MRNILVAHYGDNAMATAIRDTVEREVTYSQPIERVWAALTEPEQMRRWFCSNGAEVDLRPGGMIHFRWENETSRAIIESVEPPRRFAFRWIPAMFERPELPLEEQGPLTLVDFTLEPVEGGTRLRLVESGFAAFDEARYTKAFGMNSEGWDECIASLTAFLEGEDGR
jgi:uncharacterized protein YndB with AHSA1/START domain